MCEPRQKAARGAQGGPGDGERPGREDGGGLGGLQ